MEYAIGVGIVALVIGYIVLSRRKPEESDGTWIPPTQEPHHRHPDRGDITDDPNDIE